MLVDDIAGQSRTGGSWFLYSQLTLSNFTSLLVRSSEIEKNKFNYFRPIDNISCKRKFLLSLDALKKKSLTTVLVSKGYRWFFSPVEEPILLRILQPRKNLWSLMWVFLAWVASTTVSGQIAKSCQQAPAPKLFLPTGSIEGQRKSGGSSPNHSLPSWLA